MGRHYTQLSMPACAILILQAAAAAAAAAEKNRT
jgi:hypothetical protein